MKYGICVALFVAFSASALLAEGIPSQSKLNSLGLSSLEVASDEAGEEVRGRFFGTLAFNFLYNTGTVAAPTFVNAAPAVLTFGTDAHAIGDDQTASLGTFDQTGGNVVPITIDSTTSVTTAGVTTVTVSTISFQGGLFAATTIGAAP